MDKLEILSRCFGYTAFRPGQEELIDGVLSGRDVFGIMPTGGGKSICYQVPAMMLPGITLVISPLISLMQDQVLALKAAGIPAAYLNSTLTPAQLQLVCRNLRAGFYKIVYVAPERLDYGGFGALAAELPISFVAVDEAHCISQWGQDFRPSYLRIVQFLESLPVRPVVGAFTATATEQVREDVKRILQLRDPVCLVTGFDRANLSFEVMHPQKKELALLDLLSTRKNKSGIIYCATRKNVESICQLLLNTGYNATRYHAGLDEKERAENQQDFLFDRKTIMVATNAFGMGIDKSNVSYVIHYNMPKSIEAYYQEAGRAGRDGAEAECILLFGNADVETARYFINHDSDNEEMTPEHREMVRKQDLERLNAMVAYCKTKECLRGHILEYFGQRHPELCGNCGSCRGEFEVLDVTRQAQMILSCVRRVWDKLGYYVGASLIAQVLHGKLEKRHRDKGLQELSTYGLMTKLSMDEIRGLIDHLELEGYLVTEQEHRTLRLTERAGQVLFHGQTVEMKVRKTNKTKQTISANQSLTFREKDLFEVLKTLRAELARKSGVPAYVVFTNATLTEMAMKQPKNMGELRQISGVGQTRASWYGEAFLNKIKEFLEDNPESYTTKTS